MRIGEVNLDAALPGKLLMTGHLLALIAGHAQAAPGIDAIEHPDEALFSSLGTGIIHLRRCDKETGSLHLGAGSGGIARPLNQIAPQWPGTRRSSISGGRPWMFT